ncbi:MAG: hypothetical protein M1831_006070 [Alyxoria varia]|nr:MAG: hypothetical protein M1831_006070 [Alyxoria varia]
MDTTPIVIGVGDVKNSSLKPEDAIEPLELMLQAIREAATDTNLKSSATANLLSRIDSIDVVRCWTWPYKDLPSLISERLASTNLRHSRHTGHGGHQPAKVFDEAARSISSGECEVAVVTGGEALGSLAAYIGARKHAPQSWTQPREDVTEAFAISKRELEPGTGRTHSLGWPIQIYPLYENAFRASRSQSIQDNHIESAELYAQLARVAEKNPIAWNYGKPTETCQSIEKITSKNRMIAFPCVYYGQR